MTERPLNTGGEVDYYLVKLRGRDQDRPKVVLKSDCIEEVVNYISVLNKRAEYLEGVNSVDFERGEFQNYPPGHYILECPATNCLSVYKVKDDIKQGYLGNYTSRVTTLRSKYELIEGEI